jgi:hypothetical protein
VLGAPNARARPTGDGVAALVGVGCVVPEGDNQPGTGLPHATSGEHMVLADDFGTGQVFLDLLWFFLFVIWIWLLIVVFSDLFRSHDLSGWAKALWVIGIVILPYLGVLVYLIARGHKMAEHAQAAAKAQDAAARAYVQSAVDTSGSAADEIQRLFDLKNQGLISDDEFERGKAKALAR